MDLKTVEEGMGLPQRTWGPYPEQGCFLANITYIAANIAFKDNKWMNKVKNFDLVSSDLCNLDFTQFSRIRVTETADCDDENNSFHLTINTDLIPFTQPPSQGNQTHLLVYSIHNSRDDNSKLITTFPVDEQTVKKLLSQAQGHVDDIFLKYNLHIIGVNGKLCGTRSINEKIENF